jgi:hypothetical protein
MRQLSRQPLGGFSNMIYIDEYWVRVIFAAGGFISVIVIGLFSNLKLRHIVRKIWIHGILTAYLIVCIIISQGNIRRIIGVCFLSVILQLMAFYYLKYGHPDRRKVNINK